MECVLRCWGHDQRLIQQLHKAFPLIKIIITGTIANRAKALLKDNPIWVCVKGEYEKGILRVLNGEAGIINHDFLAEEELNTAPFP